MNEERESAAEVGESPEKTLPTTILVADGPIDPQLAKDIRQYLINEAVSRIPCEQAFSRMKLGGRMTAAFERAFRSVVQDLTSN
ncbi:hypothetical protein [Schlesneria sp.]|uniref:hypothetical protein n=1 Tax=Schlesneria sp. TaxID=2762018 RepID=UPI002F06EF17